MKKLLKDLWAHTSRRRRIQFALLLFLMLLASLVEVLSIGAILPFLGALTESRRIFELDYLQPFIMVLQLTSPSQLLLPLTIVFCMATLTAGAMRLLLLWASTRLSFAAGSELSVSMYKRTLYQPYAVHCSRNSSEVIDGIASKAHGVIYSIILPILTLISSGIMFIAITLALVAVDPIIAIATFGGFGFIYVLIVSLARKQLLIDSKRVAYESTQVIKALQEGLGGIRDVLLSGNQADYCRSYLNADLPMRRSQGNILIIASSPRYIVEALGMMLIAIIAYFLTQQDQGFSKVIPTLGLLAFGAQRLLPLLQQIYASWAQINGGQASLRDVVGLLSQQLPDHIDRSTIALPFNHLIKLNEISFSYNPKAQFILRDINLTITKGSRIGFIGTTGSGKSTLLDIVMGLLEPTAGALIVDDTVIDLSNYRNWQSNIAHVPQAIFLTDASVEENIAFGVPKDEIDFHQVKAAAQQAQIANTIEQWPKQYQTIVGERGVKLSGGQRQRIGIARALYKMADVIIFDEATSALDNETERAVMQSIEELSEDLTLLIIAHRLSTLKNCTKIVELDMGRIKQVGSYKEIVINLEKSDV